MSLIAAPTQTSTVWKALQAETANGVLVGLRVLRAAEVLQVVTVVTASPVLWALRVVTVVTEIRVRQVPQAGTG